MTEEGGWGGRELWGQTIMETASRSNLPLNGHYNF